MGSKWVNRVKIVDLAKRMIDWAVPECEPQGA